MKLTRFSTHGVAAVVFICANGCGTSDSGATPGDGGGNTGTDGDAAVAAGRGGAEDSGAAGSVSSGGRMNTGGDMSAGGRTSTGGDMSAGGNTNTGGSVSSGGRTNTGGNASSGGNANSGGGAGMSSQGACPAEPPEDAAPCTTGNLRCIYEDCDGAGRSNALCTSGSWSVETSDCAAFPCGSATCALGEICSIMAGGAFLAECVENPCGTGPITCDCVNPFCAQCDVSAYEGTGVSVTCNTCPPPGLCP